MDCQRPKEPQELPYDWYKRPDPNYLFTQLLNERLRSIRDSLLNLFDCVQSVTGAAEITDEVPFEVERKGYATITVKNISLPSRDFQRMRFFAASIDETDMALQGIGTIDASTDHIEFTPTVRAGSRYDDTFQVGSYIVWNDQANYEVDRIEAINPITHKWTLSRKPTGAKPGKAHLGSKLTAHVQQTFYLLKFYELIPTQTIGDDVPTTTTALNDEIECLHANKCVIAVMSQRLGLTSLGKKYVLNVSPTELPAEGEEPASPGIRTLNGGEYFITINGALSEGQNSKAIRYAAYETSRCTYGYLDIPAAGATGGYTVIIDAVYIAPDYSDAALLETLTWTGSDRVSDPSTTLPRTRNLPFHALWTTTTLLANPSGLHKYPPHILPCLDSIFDGDGNLLTTYTINPDRSLVIQQDGWVRFLVRQVGTGTAGSDFVGVIQT